MFHRNDRDDRHVHSPGFESDIHDDFVDAAVREKQKAIGRAENKIAKDDLTEAFHMLEEHGLSLSV